MCYRNKYIHICTQSTTIGSCPHGIHSVYHPWQPAGAPSLGAIYPCKEATIPSTEGKICGKMETIERFIPDPTGRKCLAHQLLRQALQENPTVSVEVLMAEIQPQYDITDVAQPEIWTSRSRWSCIRDECAGMEFSSRGNLDEHAIQMHRS